MILALSALYGLAQQCAPSVAPETLLAVVRAESGFDPLVVAVNGTPRRVYHPTSPPAAARLAQQLIARGESVDLGLGQLNSRNLGRLGLTAAEALAPCANLAASAQVLQAGYRRAAAGADDPQRALRTAFSLYNTGDPVRGVRNGYVARVIRAAASVTPAPPPAAVPARPPAWDVFARPRTPGVAVF